MNPPGKKTKPSNAPAQEAWQALFYLPHKFFDISAPEVDFLHLNFRKHYQFVKGRVLALEGLDRDGRPTNNPFPARLLVRLSDGASEAECHVFGPSHEWKFLEEENDITFLCTASIRDGWVNFYGPELISPRQQPRITYRGVHGKLSGEKVLALVQEAIADPDGYASAGAWLRATHPHLDKLIRLRWASVEALLRALHEPADEKQWQYALRFARRLCVAEIKQKSIVSSKPSVQIAPLPQLRRAAWDAMQGQSETLSKGQVAALKDIVPALSGDRPARILLNGDVGSGKTLVFLLVAVGMAQLGQACAIMAPSETVARQIFQQIRWRWPTLPSAYVSGEGVEGDVESGLLWVGTTALLHAKNLPEFGLVVIDEQHKFSRKQREQLLGPQTHLIEASATPVPRSLALALFDGFVQANIPTPPVSRRIVSRLVTDRADVVRAHREIAQQGGKIIYLYAAVKDKRAATEDAETAAANGLRSVNAAYADLSSIFPGQVSCVHGQMKSDDVQAHLNDFKAGVTSVLVASTAIEVGVDIPDIRMLVVNNPERFGIAALHQLRGRLARNGGEARFFMLGKRDLGKDSRARLMAVQNISDGFALAEKDMEIRGFGEVANDMQSGATTTTFKLAGLTASDFFA